MLGLGLFLEVPFVEVPFAEVPFVAEGENAEGEQLENTENAETATDNGLHDPQLAEEELDPYTKAMREAQRAKEVKNEAGTEEVSWPLIG